MSIPRPIGNLILNAFRGQPFSFSGLYGALFTSAPGTDGDPLGHEVVGFGYSRVLVTYQDPFNGTMSSAGAVTWPAATGSWGAITHIGLCDKSTGGQVVGLSATLSPTIVVFSGATLRVNNLFFRIT